MAGHAVLHRAHSSRVGGDVAAQAGRALAGEDRVDEPVVGGRLVELVEGDARLDHCDVVVEVDLEDLRHPLERHDDAVLGRDACAGKARARPRAVSGTPCSPASATMAATSSVERGVTTAAGRRGVAVSASSWVRSSLMSSPATTLPAPTTFSSRAMSGDASSAMPRKVPAVVLPSAGRAQRPLEGDSKATCHQ